MTTRRRNGKPRVVRAAAYCRKSTERGLEQDFNTIDAQREACAAYILSQKVNGWVAVDGQYEDGGFSGGNTDRPAWQRLMSDVEAGKVDLIVVTRADRLTRSLRDFVQIIDFLDKHGASFVSVSESFDTSTPSGRAFLHMLMTFSQWERETISERTAHKVAAAKRRGKWCGGVPVLGYDVEDGKLVVNAAEAERVQAIYELYEQVGSLAGTVREIRRRGWTKKAWLTKAGEKRGGGSFSKTNLRDTLVNPLYAGRVRHNGDTYPGEHDAIIGKATWERVQKKLRRNGTARPTGRSAAILRGLLFCAACDSPMHHHSTRHGPKVHRYYRCRRALENGAATCPTRTVPAAEIEAFIVSEIKAIGTDRDLLTATVREARRQLRKQISNVRRELKIARLELENGDESAVQRVADLEEELATIKEQKIDQRDLAAALKDLDGLWGAMTSAERTEVLAALIKRIDIDGAVGTIDITYRPTGFEKVLAAQEATDGH